DVLAFGLAQVDTDGFLAARLGFPPHGRAFVQQSPFAQGIARAGRFDLDDLGPEVGERLGCERARNQLAQFHDPNAGKYLTRHACSSFCFPNECKATSARPPMEIGLWLRGCFRARNSPAGVSSWPWATGSGTLRPPGAGPVRSWPPPWPRSVRPWRRSAAS